jgi:6-pyruvoyltetrahydropterin/6-carboxytetrahydropterin synthase
MYRIGISYEFEAAHFLTEVPETHKCSRMHGHNYVVEIEMASESLNEEGFVIDYFNIKPIKTFIDENWDHRVLNEVVDFNPTVENLARFLFKKFRGPSAALWSKAYNTNGVFLSSVTIRETPSTYCTYSET